MERRKGAAEKDKQPISGKWGEESKLKSMGKKAKETRLIRPSPDASPTCTAGVLGADMVLSGSGQVL